MMHELSISAPALVAAAGLFPLRVACWFSPATTLPPATSKMSRSMAPSRALLKAFQETQAPSRQCRRFLSSSQASFTRRPALANALDHPSRHQPLVQKRFKYKSVEEARSRYQIGVGKHNPSRHPLPLAESARDANSARTAALFLESTCAIRCDGRRPDLVLRT